MRAFIIRLAYQTIRLTQDIRFISKRRNIISELLLIDPRSINASASKIGQRLLSTSTFKGCSSILISRTRVRSRGSQLSKLHLQFYPAREHDLRSFDELSAEIAKILGRLCRIRKRMKKAKALKTREPENPKNPAMKMITKNVSFKNHGKKIVFMESKNNLDCYLLEEKIKKERKCLEYN